MSAAAAHPARLVASRRAAWLLLVLFVGCANNRRSAPPPARLEDASAGPDAATALVDAPPRPVWSEPADDSIVATLRRDAGDEPVALVETPAALLAVTVSGRTVRRLVSGTRISAASYEARFDTIWFVQDGALMALDLRTTTVDPVRVLEQMPPLPVYFKSVGGRLPDDPCGVPCVALTAVPPGFAVHAERSDIVPGRPDDVRRIRAVAKYRPVLTDAGAAFLSRFANEVSRPYAKPLTVSGDVVAPGVAAEPAATRRGCNGTCGRGVALGLLGWSIVSAGRTCRCEEDLCTARCVLFDPATRRFASISRASAWAASAPRAEPLCGVELDSSRTAYRLPDGGGVCTHAGCRKLGGRVFAWLVAGPAVPTDLLRESGSDGCGS